MNIIHDRLAKVQVEGALEPIVGVAGKWSGNWTVLRPRWDWVVHTFFALFLLLFSTQFDKELVSRGWLPMPGIVLFGGCMGVILIYLVAGSGRSKAEILGYAVAIWHHYRPFTVTFLALILLSSIYWFRWSDATLRDALFIPLAFIVCASSALLPLIPQVRRCWRAYLGLSFVFYCLTVWVDVWHPGTFSIFETRAAGLGIHPNDGASLVLLLVIPLLQYRRFHLVLVTLVILYCAGLTIFLTLSRGGLLLYLLLVGCYIVLTMVKFPKRRVFIGLASGVMLVSLVFSSWHATQSFEYLSSPDEMTQNRLDLITGQLSWFHVRLRTRADAPMIIRLLDRYNSFTAPPLPDDGQPVNQKEDEPMADIASQNNIENLLEKVKQNAVNRDRQLQETPIPQQNIIWKVDVEGEPIADIAGQNNRENLLENVKQNVVDNDTQLQETPVLQHNIIRKADVEDKYILIDSARVVRLKYALTTIQASPLIGYGTQFGGGGPGGISAHNMYLAQWINFGFPGFLVFVTFLATSFWGVYKQRFLLGMFLIGFIAAWSMFTHNLFDGRPFFIVLGLLLSLPLVTERSLLE